MTSQHGPHERPHEPAQPPYPTYPQPPAYRPAYPPAYQGYQQPGYPPPGYGYVPANASAIVLLVLSSLAGLATCFALGLPSGIIAIIALAQNTADPARSRRLSRLGWWVFAVNALLVLALLVGLVVYLGSLPDGVPSQWYTELTTPSPTTDIGY